MGEVYRARDIGLGRVVALKILPDTLLQHSESLARFRREAQLLASLNHPHIAVVYGLEEVPSTPSGSSGPAAVVAIALEFVDGEGLDARLARGAIPIGRGRPHRATDRRGARSRARARHRSSRSEAGERSRDVRRQGQDPRLRSCQGDRTRGRQRDHECGQLPPFTARDDGGDDRRDRCLHGAGTGARQARGQAGGHLGVRRAPLRNDHGPTPVRRRNGERHARVGADARCGPRPAARRRRRHALRTLLSRCLQRDVTVRLRDIGEARIALSGAPPAIDRNRGTATHDEKASTRRVVLLAAAIGSLIVGAAAATRCGRHGERPPERSARR